MLSQIDPRADCRAPIARKAALGKGECQSAFAAVVGRFDQTIFDRFETGSLDGHFEVEVDLGDCAIDFAGQQIKQFTRPKVCLCQPKQENAVPLILEPLSRDMSGLVDEPEHADDRGRIDPAPFCLVVEADVATRHRNPEAAAGLRNAVDRFTERPHHLRPFRIGKVEAIGDGERLGSAADDVSRRFDDGESRAFTRIEPTVSAIGID